MKSIILYKFTLLVKSDPELDINIVYHDVYVIVNIYQLYTNACYSKKWL